MAKPKVRFSGFDNDWGTDKLNKFADRITRKNLKLESLLPLTISALDGLISQNLFFNDIVASSNLEGYYLIKKGEFAYNKSYSKGYPFGTIKRLEKYDMGVLSTLYILFNSRNNISSDYVVYFFDTTLWHREVAKRATEGARNHGLLNISAEDFLDIEIKFSHNLLEQQQIASYFKSLDTLIQSTTKKIASLKQLKSASLLSMFPQAGETKPRVRFKGFEGEWKKKCLGQIFKERTETNEKGEMLSVTMNNGIIKASDNGRFDNSNNDKSKYKVVKVNDIAYNSMRMWQGASGCSNYDGIVSPAYTVITPEQGIVSEFFAYLFKTKSVIMSFRINSQGLTSDNWNLKYPAFSKIEVMYPDDKCEQQQIASFFQSLDTQITLETQRLDKLKQIKSSCLDKMFV